MYQSFLEHVLDRLQEKEINPSQCTFVLPSKRSGTFLKKFISKRLQQNTFAPKIFSIQDFIADISGMDKAPNLELLLTLFEVYQKSNLEEHDDFPTFMKWGQVLLQDFDEIDGYLIPPKDILNYLSAIKELNHWSLQKEKTELVKNYLQLWNNLESLYNGFTKTLLKQQRGYQGLMSRVAVDHLEAYGNQTKNQPIVFVGFNALNNSESTIVQYFLEQGNGLIFWDIDTHFLNDPIHDAGLFIRKYQREWPYYKNKGAIEAQDHFLATKRIEITGVPKSISQTKYVGQLLQNLNDSKEIDLAKTAVVLADETLLTPMLKAVPASIESTNITMGLPLDKTVLHSFYLSFLDLSSIVSERGWLYKNVLEFLSNPYTSVLAKDQPLDFAKAISNDIKQNNWLYLDSNTLSHYADASEILKIIFPGTSISPSQWVDCCLLLTLRLKALFQKEENALELEQLYRFYTLFNQLKQHLDKLGHIKELRSIKSLFKQLANMENLDFVGEPLTGLQIMGMLESRNLDYETVIITSVNEGILPSGKSNNSFVPFDVKRDYGLPTYKEKDAIYTYHFYRLIQRAKNVFVIYNTEPDVLEGGEKSRLVSQLLTDKDVAPFVTHTISTPQTQITAETLLQITKGEQLRRDIVAFAENGFSPTSLTNYIRNPIDFYTRNILKINDVEEVEENIAANTFGTIVHDSLEDLYQPLLGQVLTKENVSAVKPQIAQTVQQHFNKNLSGVDVSKGKYLLVYNVIVKYLENFIGLELQQLQRHEVKLLALEERYECQLDIPGLDFPIKLKGTLDRVDQIDGITRVVDYKTGKVEPKNVKITDWEELITNYDKSKAFQLLCYALLYTKKHGEQPLHAGIYSFKNLGQGFFPFTEDKNPLIDAKVLETFTSYLEQLIKEICSTQTPLTEKPV